VPARAAEVDVAEFSGVHCAQKETADEIEQVLVEYLQYPAKIPAVKNASEMTCLCRTGRKVFAYYFAVLFSAVLRGNLLFV